jgi:hypothetical protein
MTDCLFIFYQVHLLLKQLVVVVLECENLAGLIVRSIDDLDEIFLVGKQTFLKRFSLGRYFPKSLF